MGHNKSILLCVPLSLSSLLNCEKTETDREEKRGRKRGSERARESERGERQRQIIERE